MSRTNLLIGKIAWTKKAIFWKVCYIKVLIGKPIHIFFQKLVKQTGSYFVGKSVLFFPVLLLWLLGVCSWAGNRTQCVQKIYVVTIEFSEIPYFNKYYHTSSLGYIATYHIFLKKNTTKTFTEGSCLMRLLGPGKKSH